MRVRDVVEYTLILTNAGNLDALDLALTDLVPTCTFYVNDSATPTAELVNRTLIWRIARLAPGESFTARFQSPPWRSGWCCATLQMCQLVMLK